MPVYKDDEKGTWYVQTAYHDSLGERVRVTKRGFERKGAAKDWEQDLLARHDGSVAMTFGSFYGVYEDDVRPRLKRNTWIQKEYVIRQKILPFFGSKRMCDITPADVLHWQTELIAHRSEDGKPYSPSYLRTISNQLSAIFNHAMRFYGLDKNPMRGTTRMGSKRTKEMSFWTKEEYLRFSETLMDSPRTFIAFEILYWTGIREGELLALSPSDFDLEKRVLKVTKSYQRLRGEDVITEPKTPKSVRTIVLPSFLCDEVAEYFELVGPKPEERVFPCTKSFLAGTMKTHSQEAGVKRIRIHDLRHSHVSLLINMGFSALAIAERLGHESVDVTYRYAHLFPDKQEEMATKLDAQRGESL